MARQSSSPLSDTPHHSTHSCSGSTSQPPPSPPPPASSSSVTQKQDKSGAWSSVWSVDKSKASLGKYRRDTIQKEARDNSGSQQLRKHAHPKVSYDEAKTEAVDGLKGRGKQLKSKDDDKIQEVDSIFLIPEGMAICNEKTRQFHLPRFSDLRGTPFHITTAPDGSRLSFDISSTQKQMHEWVRSQLPTHMLSHLKTRVALENLSPRDPFFPLHRRYNTFSIILKPLCSSWNGKYVSDQIKKDKKATGDIYILSNPSISANVIADWKKRVIVTPIPSRMDALTPSPPPSPSLSSKKRPLPSSSEDEALSKKGKGKGKATKSTKRRQKSPSPTDSDADLELAMTMSKQEVKQGDSQRGEGSSHRSVVVVAGGAGGSSVPARQLRPRPRPRQEIINVDEDDNPFTHLHTDNDPFDLTYPALVAPALTPHIPQSSPSYAYLPRFTFSDDTPAE